MLISAFGKGVTDGNNMPFAGLQAKAIGLMRSRARTESSGVAQFLFQWVLRRSVQQESCWPTPANRTCDDKLPPTSLVVVLLSVLAPTQFPKRCSNHLPIRRLALQVLNFRSDLLPCLLVDLSLHIHLLLGPQS